MHDNIQDIVSLRMQSISVIRQPDNKSASFNKSCDHGRKMKESLLKKLALWKFSEGLSCSSFILFPLKADNVFLSIPIYKSTRRVFIDILSEQKCHGHLCVPDMQISYA